MSLLEIETFAVMAFPVGTVRRQTGGSVAEEPFVPTAAALPCVSRTLLVWLVVAFRRHSDVILL